MIRQVESTIRPTTTTAATPDAEARGTSPDPQETLRKLREVANLKITDNTPAWMGGTNEWAKHLSALCKDAADLLERTLP
jgi:hypothetical protein